MRTSYSRPKGKANWTVENFAERVFISRPRLFSFSHRVLTSLRHPYLSVVVELVDSEAFRKKDRVGELLGALVQSRDEEHKWNRVASMFDLKLTAEEVDGFRRKISLNHEIGVYIEKIWSRLGGITNKVIKEDEYRAFHYKLYSYLLNIDSVNVISSSSVAVSEDYAYDKRDNVGVTFGSFAVSMLELADNWTKTREQDEYISFFKNIHDTCLETRKLQFSQSDVIPNYEKPLYFSFGIITQVEKNDDVVFVKQKIF